MFLCNHRQFDVSWSYEIRGWKSWHGLDHDAGNDLQYYGMLLKIKSRKHLFICLFIYLFVYWPHSAACGILVPPPGIEPIPPHSESA